MESNAVDELGASTSPRPLRTAYDRIISGMRAGRAQMVFDEFWREGELASMFGESGVGKSILAMQLADALASGGDIPWFRMESPAGKTLYVDLSMSDRQFASRNSYRGRGGEDRARQVSKRLYCDRPDDDLELIEWLERRIEAEKLKYVIIDDLSSVMRTCDGTRDTVAVMRGLRRICGRFGVSILVVVQSDAPKENAALSEQDLGRQRVLCRLAGSVFGIGHSKRSGYVYLAQTRSHGSRQTFTGQNSISARVTEYRGRLLLWFEMNISEEERRLIKAVNELRRKGLSFREIAIKLNVSKSRAHRLGRRWMEMYSQELESRLKAEEEEWDDEDEDEAYLSDVGQGADVKPVLTSGLSHSSKAELEVKPLLTRGLLHSQEPELEVKPLLTRGLSRSSELDVKPLLTSGPMNGPEPCPFMYNGSDAAKLWRSFLVSRHPDKEYSEVNSAYIRGDAWARPPGSKPPIDPEDPFAGLETQTDVRGNIKFVVGRDVNGKPSIYYAYRPDGRLRKVEWEKETLANPNLFGKFADIGRDGKPSEVLWQL